MSKVQDGIDSVCKQRGLPNIKKGMVCEVDGRRGRIVGYNSSANFNVRFEGGKQSFNCHPEWKMTIFNTDGSILHESEDD